MHTCSCIRTCVHDTLVLFVQCNTLFWLSLTPRCRHGQPIYAVKLDVLPCLPPCCPQFFGLPTGTCWLPSGAKTYPPCLLATSWCPQASYECQNMPTLLAGYLVVPAGFRRVPGSRRCPSHETTRFKLNTMRTDMRCVGRGSKIQNDTKRHITDAHMFVYTYMRI